MSIFWLCIVVMLVIALALFIVPVIRGDRAEHTSRDALNKAFYHHRLTELEEDEDAGGDSGDSDKAHSPAASKSSGGYSLSPSKSPSTARGGSGAVNKKSYKEDDEGDEYSLDDFEPDGQHSPMKMSAAAAALDAKPVLSSSNTRHPGAPPSSTGASPMVSSGSSGAIGATGGIVPSYMATKPPSELGLPASPSPSMAKKTLTPTNSTSSMHSASKAANSGMNSVEEIMQRWYTADSDFTQRSLQRLGTGGNFSLDDEDVSGECFCVLLYFTCICDSFFLLSTT